VSDLHVGQGGPSFSGPSWRPAFELKMSEEEDIDYRSVLSDYLSACDIGGSFAMEGSVADTHHPGLQVEGMGRIGFPMCSQQAKSLIKRMEQVIVVTGGDDIDGGVQ
jgi:hypothetical protein